MAQSDTDNPQGARQPNGSPTQVATRPACCNPDTLTGQLCKCTKVLGDKMQAYPYAGAAIALGVGLVLALGWRSRRRR